jgi:Tfp pilus assembly protein PilO
MAIEDIPTDIILELSKIGKWIQAVGLVIILWIVFQIIILINNRIKRKKLHSIEQILESIEKKINILLRKKK